jgi:hypothetical protein
MQDFFTKISKYLYGIEVGQFYEEPVGDDFYYPDW